MLFCETKIAFATKVIVIVNINTMYRSCSESHKTFCRTMVTATHHPTLFSCHFLSLPSLTNYTYIILHAAIDTSAGLHISNKCNSVITDKDTKNIYNAVPKNKQNYFIVLCKRS